MLAAKSRPTRSLWCAINEHHYWFWIDNRNFRCKGLLGFR